MRVLVPPPKAGRPTLYKPEYCAIVEDLGRQGKSPAQIASILNVDRASLLRWAAVAEEFAQSLARAKDFEQAWWEDHAQSNLKAKHYQANVWRTSVAARFKEDYQERSQVNVSVTLESLVGQSYNEGDKAKVIEGKAQDVALERPERDK